ncbi:4394_t:CDS:10 [Entrophospora sp. SA101]|nr:4394_t:CDS:10 [Entrophospora sp. SA101]
MANRTVPDAIAIHGTNPQYLIEKIIRTRIYESLYWKEYCFGLTAETLIDRAIDLQSIGGQYGNQKPTEFLCLTLKLLQLQPSKEIIIEFIKDENYKYLRALGAFYLRLVGTSLEIYQYLEPLLNDYRKLRKRTIDGGFIIVHMDEFIDELLREDRVCDIILPRIIKRHVLEENEDLKPRERKNQENISGTFKLSEESVPKRKKNNDHEKIYGDPKRTKTIDKAENIDDKKQIPVQSHLKYPNKDSPDNIWKLPSGKSIDKIIRGPKNLHKSHPSCLGILRIGSKIRKPEWIKQEDWDYLNSSVEYPHYNLSTEIEDLFNVLLETNSLNEYKNCLYNVTFDREKNIEMTFVTDVLLWFAKNIFNTTSAFHSINKNEALLGSLMIHPSPNDKGLEIGMVELSGGYLTKDTPRYLKDHVKGNWGCRDLLNEIITKYNHGDYKILRHLRVWFFHIHGLEVQIWGMDLPVAKTYRMFLIDAFYLPIRSHNTSLPMSTPLIPSEISISNDDSPEVFEALDLKTKNQNQSKSQNESHKKKGTENIAQVIADGIQDALAHSSTDNIHSDLNHVTEISVMGHQEESNHMTEISTTSCHQNHETEILPENLPEAKVSIPLVSHPKKALLETEFQ